jgi:hypothetical protein
MAKSGPPTLGGPVPGVPTQRHSWLIPFTLFVP